MPREVLHGGLSLDSTQTLLLLPHFKEIMHFVEQRQRWRTVIEVPADINDIQKMFRSQGSIARFYLCSSLSQEEALATEDEGRGGCLITRIPPPSITLDRLRDRATTSARSCAM